MKIKSGVTKVTSSGTAVQLRAKDEIVIRIYLSVPVGNTGSVYFGDSTVEGSGTVSGLELAKPTATDKDLYVDAANNDDNLHWLAVIQ
jgi:hypothetical protein